MAAAVLGALIFLAAIAAVYLYIAAQGDEATGFLLEERSSVAFLRHDSARLVFSLVLPLGNSGRQDGFVLDAFARALLPQEQFGQGRVSCRLERLSARREDGYMEAFIARSGRREDFVLTLEFTPLPGFSADDVRQNIPDLTVDIYHTVVGRTSPKIRKAALRIFLEEFQAGQQVAP